MSAQFTSFRRAAAALATGLAAVAASAGSASAQSALGVWIDHTGRGAVEITECGTALCGRVVWLQDAKNAKACGSQVIGDVRSVGNNTWDRGWIIDPDDNSRYSVELKTIGPDRLRVVGYMGSKLFSETMTWKRAPADLKRCDGKGTQEARLPAEPAPAAPVVTAPAEKPALATPGTPQPLPPAIVLPPRPVQQPTVTVLPPSDYPPARPSETRPEPQVTDAPPAPEAEPAPAPRRNVSGAPRETAEAPAPRKRRSGNNCKLDLPYITLNYPCDAF